MQKLCASDEHLNLYLFDFTRVILFAVLCVLINTALNLPEQIAKNGEKVHKVCLGLIHRSSPSFQKESEIAEAYLCGKNLSEGPWRDLFIKSSLYHLIVISGSHLTLLFYFLNFITLKNKLLQITTGLLFTAGTAFQAPLVRSLTENCVSSLSKKMHWQHHKIHHLLFASIACLILFPNWIQSLSLQLSIGAALSVQNSSLFISKANNLKSIILKSALTYLQLLPLLWGWAQIHPFGIFTNLVLAPAFGLALWIFCGLWLPFPELAKKFLQLLMSSLEMLCSNIPLVSEFGISWVDFIAQGRWLYLLTLMAIGIGGSIAQRRNSL